MSPTLYQKGPPVCRPESNAIEQARRTLSQTILLRLLYANDPVRGPRLARWEETARLRLRQLRGLPISRQAHLACAYADRQKYSYLATSPNLSPEVRAWAKKFLDIAEREIAALQRQLPVQLELFAGMPPLPARGPPRRKRFGRKPG
jgi:hypothetical protein